MKGEDRATELIKKSLSFSRSQTKKGMFFPHKFQHYAKSTIFWIYL